MTVTNHRTLMGINFFKFLQNTYEGMCLQNVAYCL